MKEYVIDNNAKSFMQTMKKMGDDVRTDMEKIMNGTADKTFNHILAASPVDKGNYLASNRIAVGTERTDAFEGDFGGARKSQGRWQAAVGYAKAQAMDFRWKMGDDGVWFSNNVGHAGDVEDGGPRWVQATPYKVYEHAERLMRESFIPQEVAKVGL